MLKAGIKNMDTWRSQMSRLSGFVLAGIVIFGLAGAAGAQVVDSDPYESGSAYDGYFYSKSSPGDGGFGLGYAQPVREGSLVMDRFGMFYMAPAARTASPPDTTAAVSAPVRRRRGAPSRTEAKRVQAQPRYQMPTGSLFWSGANSGILYSPGMRYQTYGGGYARSPYGAVDHSIMYKGWELGY